MGILLFVVAILLAVSAVTVIILSLRVRPATHGNNEGRIERARAEADRILDRARQAANRLRTAASEELAAQEESLDALHASTQESDKLFRDEQHRFNQHRFAYKQLRSVQEQREEELRIRQEELDLALVRQANMPIEDASAQVLRSVEADLESVHDHRVAHHIEQLQDPEPMSRRLITLALQRQDASHTTEPFRSVQVSLESMNEERRARVLAALESLAEPTSMELTVDADAASAVFRGVDPVGREVARQAAMEIVDRSVQVTEVPPLIISKRSALVKKMREAGTAVMWELSLPGREELAELIGTLNYRFSYGQNALIHCKEAGYLCGVLASELGVDITTARHAGMLHDIGKAVDHDVEGSHAVIGAELLTLMGVPDNIVHAVRAHHYEEEPTTDLALLTICADAISASRPGARRDTIATYLARLEQLQSIATRHRGVERAYPLHAGREIRVIVQPNHVSDTQVGPLSSAIAKEIEEEMNYPGVVKVTVIRESQTSAVAPVQITPVRDGETTEGSEDSASSPRGHGRSSRRPASKRH